MKNLEEINAELAKALAEVQSPDYKRPTVESLQAKLDAGEIDQAEYDRTVYNFGLTKEARAERWENIRKIAETPNFHSPLY